MSKYNSNVYDDLKLLLCFPSIFVSECTERTGSASKPKKATHRITLTKRRRKHCSKTDTREPDSVSMVSADYQEITVAALVGILQDPDKGVPRALTTALKDVKVRKGKVASKISLIACIYTYHIHMHTICVQTQELCFLVQTLCGGWWKMWQGWREREMQNGWGSCYWTKELYFILKDQCMCCENYTCNIYYAVNFSLIGYLQMLRHSSTMQGRPGQPTSHFHVKKLKPCWLKLVDK